MKNVYYILILASLLLACNSRKNADDTNQNGIEDIVTDSMRPDSFHHPSPDEFMDGHTPPPHGKVRPPHKPDNMRGFDPASEDDMEDNGMSRYMENNDEEGWD